MYTKSYIFLSFRANFYTIDISKFTGDLPVKRPPTAKTKYVLKILIFRTIFLNPVTFVLDHN